MKSFLNTAIYKRWKKSTSRGSSGAATADVALTKGMRLDSSICDRCVENWKDIRKPQYFAFQIIAGRSYFDPTKCRICRLLVEAISPHLVDNSRIIVRHDLYGWHGADVFDINITVSREDDCTRDFEIRLSCLDTQHLDNKLARTWPKDADLDTLKPWIHSCEEHHQESCRPKDSSNLKGLKVVDCTQGIVVSAPPDCKFVALSYVWGSCCTSRYVKDAPPTIADSIAVTLKLGCKYLWVDRYVRPIVFAPQEASLTAL